MCCYFKGICLTYEYSLCLLFAVAEVQYQLIVYEGLVMLVATG